MDNEKIGFKEFLVFKCEGKIPDEKGFFVSNLIGLNEIIIHGGCNYKKEFNQICILNTSIFIFY